MAADDSVWAEFDRGWKDILSSHNPPAPYMHMKDAIPLNEPFTRSNGWDNRKVYHLIHKLIKFMSGMDKNKFRQFVCTIDMDAYRKLEASGIRMDTPLDICNGCPEVILKWYIKDYPGIIEHLHFFFDQTEPFEDNFRKLWKAQKQNSFYPHGNDIFWGLIKTVTSADMRDRPALQAADMLAWSVNRDLTSTHDRPMKSLAYMMHQIIPTTGILWDEKRLRGQYEKK